ncbi:MAG: hypothetical protein EZS28_018751 [Streblomastix strix]|uniref:Tc1-like transposase DDE domain-containing protein n=1 Tax=Streblomastix strix TaxID=222440 RepID=A0A5J4VSZ9_9EUKA|nr:MAG: hypothetical protein EZS28_018751 [Streblomastix strix]
MRNVPAQQSKNPKVNVMVWGAVAYGFKPNLIVVENTLDSEVYVDMLKKKFFGIVKKHYGRIEFRFQQDNAPCHASKFTKAALNKLHISTYESGVPYTDKDALTAGIKAAWTRVSQTYIDDLVDGMYKRLSECITNNGLATHY